MPLSLKEFHHTYRSQIIDEWVDKLKKNAGPLYAARPREELVGTITQAFQANYHFLVEGRMGPINRFINKICKKRLETGFLLSDVQTAFELYRIIVIPILNEQCSNQNFVQAVEKINVCLAYTIRRFSEHFQDMHEKKILDHNRQLEDQVRARTRALRESELRYKILVEEINDGYFVIRDQIIVFANRAFCQMHGYLPEEVLGKKFYDFLAPVDRKSVIDIYKKSIENQPSPAIFEYMRLTKDGREYPTEIRANIADYDGRLSNIGICRDMTERVKMEKKVRESERLAYIGQITTSLSHEIRNPLSAVKMNLQILEKNPDIQGNDKRRVEISVRETTRLERILNQLLDFAKPLQVVFAPVDLNGVLNICREALDVKFKEKHLRVTENFDETAPFLLGDAGKLEQAFFNLFFNAVDASAEGGSININSLFHADCEKPHMEVLVSDEGHGIETEVIKKIFKPFFSTRTKGTGLGLSNVKRIVRAHGGRIEAENRPSNGATFRVTLPLGRKHG
jgi:PAS domain S-box-containing protein